jgi:hypothetical protein
LGYEYSWDMNIEHEFANIGVTYLWDKSDIHLTAYMIIEPNILDVYKQSLTSYFSTSPIWFLYQHLVDNFCRQFYLKKLLIAMERNI